MCIRDSIEPASKTEPMEVDLGTGEFSQIRVKNVGTIAPDHEVKCRYILKYGFEQVWTCLLYTSHSVTDIEFGTNGNLTNGGFLSRSSECS